MHETFSLARSAFPGSQRSLILYFLSFTQLARLSFRVRFMISHKNCSNKTKTLVYDTRRNLLFATLRLLRKIGLKEEFAETLYLCRHCRCLFWKSFGHPCVCFPDLADVTAKSDVAADESNGNQAAGELDAAPPPSTEAEHIAVPEHIPVPPQAFLKFFSL